MENKDDITTVSRFTHENALWHYGNVNKRSMVMLISVCIAFVLMTAIWVTGSIIHDTLRDKNWLDYVAKLQAPVAEVADNGVHEQPNP